MINKKKLVGYTNNQSKIGKVARKVNDAVGGKGLRNYFGGTGTKKGAAMSAATVATSLAGVAGAGRAIAANVSKKAVTKKALDPIKDWREVQLKRQESAMWNSRKKK